VDPGVQVGPLQQSILGGEQVPVDRAQDLAVVDVGEAEPVTGLVEPARRELEVFNIERTLLSLPIRCAQL